MSESNKDPLGEEPVNYMVTADGKRVPLFRREQYGDFIGKSPAPASSEVKPPIKDPLGEKPVNSFVNAKGEKVLLFPREDGYDSFRKSTVAKTKTETRADVRAGFRGSIPVYSDQLEASKRRRRGR